MHALIQQGSAQERRDVLLAIVDTITVNFTQERRNDKTYSTFAGAEILYNKNSRGNQTRLELLGAEFDEWPASIMLSMLDMA